ncbi:MAG: hypothetical protein QHC65_09995 [Sphingomonas sp.]|nr:hypothetical protein [Sphingomonas sp.]MDX3884743.1 hypothetical protein [Sphingomonas sp.]
MALRLNTASGGGRRQARAGILVGIATAALAAGGLGAALLIGGGGDAPAAPVAPGPVPPTTLGLNLAGLSTWGGERTFMNLAIGGGWASEIKGQRGWKKIDATRLNAAGMPISLQDGEVMHRSLAIPEGVYGANAVRIRCTWQGKGSLAPGGGARNASQSGNAFDFDWPGSNGAKPKGAWISLSRIDAADPVRGIDCREKSASPTALFAPAFLQSLSGFSLVRFLDWQKVNGNAEVSWATRATTGSLEQNGPAGPAVEYMVALANEAKVDPWFHMHWNADEDYVRRFAEYVRDNLAPGRKAYVEMSNEVWNLAFPVTKQAQAEGLKEGLDSDQYRVIVLRYAEKATWMNRIWTDVFKADPGRLVRVVATQNAGPQGTEAVLGFRDTAKFVDAVATAPYFGNSTFRGERATILDPANIFAYLDKDVDAAIGKALANKAVATRYGKRYIAYEAGQHLVYPPHAAEVAQLNRDPRMYDVYRKYLAAWKSRVGDTMTLYAATGSYGPFGAWGLREYGGQPMDQTPKRRAAEDFLAGK